jgi:hypothetical protein
LSINRVKVLSGHIYDPADQHAVMISQGLADRTHLQPGGTLHLLGYPQRGGNPVISHPVRLAFRVSAIVVTDDEIVSATRELSAPRVLLSPAFARSRLAQSFNPAGGGSYIVLRPGADAAAFSHQAAALASQYRVGGLQVVHLATEYAAAQRAIRPQAIALAIFAALAALIALAVVAQLLYRQLMLDAADFPILRVLGMNRIHLMALSLARVLLVTGGGAVVAVGVTIAASPLMPIGPARFAEPSPGIDINLAILGAGVVIIAAAPLLLLAPGAVRAATQAPGALGLAEPPGPARPSRLAPALGLAGAVPGSLGVRMAVEAGHGRTAVPVRSALAGTTLTVAAVVAALVFGTSFLGLVGTPHQYGQKPCPRSGSTSCTAAGSSLCCPATRPPGPGRSSWAAVPCGRWARTSGSRSGSPRTAGHPQCGWWGRRFSRRSAWPAATPPTWAPVPQSPPRYCRNRTHLPAHVG